MPLDQPALTDEEAWDVAAFVHPPPRPEKAERHDWPEIRTRPRNILSGCSWILSLKASINTGLLGR